MQSREAYVKALIRRRYARLASGEGNLSGGRERAIHAGYPMRVLDRLPPAVVAAWSGCGNAVVDAPLAGARLVVDLGGGSGVDALLAASASKDPICVVALDLTPEMIQRLGTAHADVLPVVGDYESVPLADAACDVVIANAAFNLALHQDVAFAEALRILRPGGRLHICELVREGELPAELLTDPMGWSTSLGGVVPENELVAAIRGAGFIDVAVHGHRPFPPVVSVYVDASKPLT